MHETQQPRDPKKTTGIVYAVILVVLLLLNFWAFPAMMKGQVKQVDYGTFLNMLEGCLLYTSPSPRDERLSRMPSSA